MTVTSSPVRIWTVCAHHAAFRCGGWAYVREAGGGDLSGAAGGERYVTAERMALAGLAAAMTGLPKAAGVAIHTPNAWLMARGPLIGGTATGDEAPVDDLDLWARIIAAAQGRKVRLIRTAVEPKSPLAFAAAWADLARDKAKASGPFTSPIPKPNLAKVAGLG